MNKKKRTGAENARRRALAKPVKKLMRHSDINLTMNIYTHVQPSETHAAIDKLPDFQEQTQLENKSERYAS